MTDPFATEVAHRVGRRARRRRRAIDMTQEELAFRAGIHRTQITLFERGRRMPYLYTLIKLAGGLEVPACSLIEGIDWKVAEPWPAALLAGDTMDSRPSERFAGNLRRLRAEAGFSQEGVAYRAAIHRTQISLLEGGERMPIVETLVKLAGALGATPNDLLDGITWEPIETFTGGLVVTPIDGPGDA